MRERERERERERREREMSILRELDNERNVSQRPIFDLLIKILH